MMIGDRDRLLGRIRQMRRAATAREQQGHAGEQPSEDAVRALEERVAHLEQLLEGLQDSVHREFERHDEVIARLQTEIEPATLGAALARDARKRGL